jgi:hypothetical protein
MKSEGLVKDGQELQEERKEKGGHPRRVRVRREGSASMEWKESYCVKGIAWWTKLSKKVSAACLLARLGSAAKIRSQPDSQHCVPTSRCHSSNFFFKQYHILTIRNVALHCEACAPIRFSLCG